jgi:branched-chain amino acid aminotransferase
LRAATLELVARNELRSCYIRPLVYRGYGVMGLNPLDAPVEVAIAMWEWGAYLGDESKTTGIRAKVSSWERISPRSLIPHAKASGQYLNSVLAKIESLKGGYDEAILLDDHGHVCEGSAENIYVVRDGVIVTPPQTASILDGINRRAVLQIARDLGYPIVERDVARAELYLADEVFFSGTGAELVPVREIDDHAIGDGKPGEITKVLLKAFDDALHGRSERYLEWLDLVEVGERASA